MERHELQLRFGKGDKRPVGQVAPGSKVLRLDLEDNTGALRFGLHQVRSELAERGLRATDVALDLLVLAIGVQIADTRISREQHAQDSWTREIDFNVPVSDPALWTGVKPLLERMLKFLSGDRWTLAFRAAKPIPAVRCEKPAWPKSRFDGVCLFSGGMDSYLGAIGLLSAGRNPLLVSHYWDLGTSSQAACATNLAKKFGDITPRHLRVFIGADKNSFPLEAGEKTDNSQRARSFIFFSIAAVAASCLGETTITVPENGFVSLNVPLDPHRVGAWTTRTTHPFYMARWNELLKALGIKAALSNPYQTMTKGEMLLASPEADFVRSTVGATLSCSSVSKARWGGLGPGHCGHCFPCLVRRAAELKAFKEEVTTYQKLPTLTQTVEKDKAIGEDIWSFRVMADRLRLRPADARALVYKTGPLADYSLAERQVFADVFARGIAEVGEAIKMTTIT